MQTVADGLVGEVGLSGKVVEVAAAKVGAFVPGEAADNGKPGRIAQAIQHQRQLDLVTGRLGGGLLRRMPSVRYG